MSIFTTPRVALRVLITKIFSSSLKKTVAYYSSGVVIANSKVVGLAPGAYPTNSQYYNLQWWR
jgi:hypothetical protein